MKRNQGQRDTKPLLARWARAGGAGGEGTAGCRHSAGISAPLEDSAPGDDGKNAAGNKIMIFVSVASKIFGKRLKGTKIFPSVSKISSVACLPLGLSDAPISPTVGEGRS